MTELEVAPLAPTDPRSIAGYVLRGRLGEGGMGVVFLADRPGGDTTSRAALKIIRSEVAADPEFVRRFEREVQSTKAVRSGAVAAFIDSGVDDGTPWLAIAYHPGLTLKDWVQANGPLDSDQVEVLARGLLVGLADIHRAGLVHRDLKPSNVLLTGAGPVIIDFGVALATEGTSITRTGRSVGSPGWMAPEQVTGGRIDQAVDVFGWASVVQYAATGDSPFGKGRPEAQLYRVRHAAPTPHGVDGVLGQMVTAGLTKEPGLRPDVEAVAAALDGAYLSGPETVVTDTPFTRLDLPLDVIVSPLDKPRSPLLVAALITLVIAVGVAVLVAAVGSGVSVVADQAGLDENRAESVSSAVEDSRPAAEDPDDSEVSAVGSESTAECTSGKGSVRLPDERPVPERAARSLFGSIWPGALLAVPLDEAPRDSVTLGDGRVATITFTNDLLVWDPADPLTGLLRWEPLPSTTWVLAPVADSQVAVGSGDGTIAIFDANEPGQGPAIFEAHDDQIIGVLGLCDGRVAATGRSSTDVAIVDPATGAVQRWIGDGQYDTLGPTAMTRLAGERVAVAGLGGQIAVFDFADGAMPEEPDEVIATGLRSGIVDVWVLDDGVIVAVAVDGQSEAWQMGAESPVAERRIGPDDWLGATGAPLGGGRLAIGDRFGAARVWHPLTDRIVELDAGQLDSDTPIVAGDENREIATTAAGHVVAVSFDGVMRIWPAGLDIDEMPVIVSPAAVVMLDPDSLASGHQIAALGDGRIAASGSALRIIDVQASIAASANPLPAIEVVAATDELIAVARADGRISVLDGAELVIDIPGEGRVVTALAIEGDTIVVATADGSTNQDGALISRIVAGVEATDTSVEAAVTVIRPLGGGSGALALGLADGTVRRLDSDGAISLIFEGAQSAVAALDQLDDGRLVVGADDSAFWLIDLSNGDVVVADHPYGSPAPLLVWGQRIVTAGGSGRFRLWDPLDIGADPQIVETGRHAIVGFTQLGERLVVANEVGELRAYANDGSLVGQRDLSRSLAAVAGTRYGGLDQVVVASESGASAIDLLIDNEEGPP